MNDSPVSYPPLAVRTLGDGPPLLLFHGGMGSWNHWARNFAVLGARFAVRAVDLPGFGGSYTVAKSMPKDEYIERVLAGIRGIVTAEPFRLAGFSFGGVVAAAVAARLGEQVQKLSLMAVGGFGRVNRLDMQPIPDPAVGESARRAALRNNLAILMLADPANVTEESIDFYADNYRTTRYDGRDFSRSHMVASSLEHIRCRVQFIYGDQDSLACGDLERRAQLVRGLRPDAQFVVLAGAGHWVQYEAAEQVNRLLLDFF